jgi:hypothetical protein
MDWNPGSGLVKLGSPEVSLEAMLRWPIRRGGGSWLPEASEVGCENTERLGLGAVGAGEAYAVCILPTVDSSSSVDVRLSSRRENVRVGCVRSSVCI